MESVDKVRENTGNSVNKFIRKYWSNLQGKRLELTV